MHRQGFFSDERMRLFQLRNQLWRACRVIVDVGLHTGKMSFNEAAGFLVRKAKLERHNALAELRRFCETPTQAMSCVVGKLLIEELRDDTEAEQGAEFTLRGFHDNLLAHGTIPLDLVRREMGVARRAQEKEILRVLTHTPRSLHPGRNRVRRTGAPLRDTLRKNPDAWMAHNNLGNLLQAEGQLDAALADYRAALNGFCPGIKLGTLVRSEFGSSSTYSQGHSQFPPELLFST